MSQQQDSPSPFPEEEQLNKMPPAGGIQADEIHATNVANVLYIREQHIHMPKDPTQPKDDQARRKYLEQVHKRYNSVTLPIGPAEGFSLQAIFQPLALRRDPLAAGDLERNSGAGSWVNYLKRRVDLIAFPRQSTGKNHLRRRSSSCP